MGKSTKNDHFLKNGQKRHETGQKPGVSWDLTKNDQKTTKKAVVATKKTAEERRAEQQQRRLAKSEWPIKAAE